MDHLLHHPHVRALDHYTYVVDGPADKFLVFASEEVLGAWHARPTIGSQSMRAAGLRTRDEAEDWVEAHTVQFGSLEEALTFALTRCGADL